MYVYYVVHRTVGRGEKIIPGGNATRLCKKIDTHVHTPGARARVERAHVSRLFDQRTAAVLCLRFKDILYLDDRRARYAS